jgi:hypothetical protein
VQRNIDPVNKNDEFYGNNAAVFYPACDKVFVVSAMHEGEFRQMVARGCNAPKPLPWFCRFAIVARELAAGPNRLHNRIAHPRFV